MTRLLALLLTPFFPSPAAAQTASSAQPIMVIQPVEGSTAPTVSSLYVIGSVAHPKSAFRINGRPVRPHRLGGFLAYLPVSTGPFVFRCELDLSSGTAVLERHVYVTPPYSAPPTGAAAIDESSLFPSEDLELLPGDWARTRLRGTPGLEASFQLPGRKDRHPMPEKPGEPGVYQGALQLQPGEALEPGPVRFQLQDPSSGSSAAALSKGTVSLLSGPPPVATVKSKEAVNVRAGPGQGFILFPPPGTKLLTAGRQGDQFKVRLSHGLSGWVGASSVQLLPAGTAPPRAALGDVRTRSGAGSSLVLMGVTDQVPFLIETREDAAILTLKLFYTTDHTQWMIYDSTDDYVSEVRWRQEDSDTVAVQVHYDPGRPLWGYHASWEGGTLRLELRRAPRLAARGSAFQGLTVVVDPGHTPSQPGAPGPRGTLEKDVNLAIAKALEGLLRKEGARAVMTRTGEEEVGLWDRARIAWEARADIFISVHNDRLNELMNPFKYPHGFTVFYYHPHSLALAKAVHRSYRRRIPLQDQGLWFGDLFIPRITAMPTVLVESAYMTYPGQEALLLSPPFQRQLARAQLEGMRDFLEAERRRQRAAPRPAGPPAPLPFAPETSPTSPTPDGWPAAEPAGKAARTAGKAAVRAAKSSAARKEKKARRPR